MFGEAVSAVGRYTESHRLAFNGAGQRGWDQNYLLLNIIDGGKKYIFSCVRSYMNHMVRDNKHTCLWDFAISGPCDFWPMGHWDQWSLGSMKVGTMGLWD